MPTTHVEDISLGSIRRPLRVTVRQFHKILDTQASNFFSILGRIHLPAGADIGILTIYSLLSIILPTSNKLNLPTMKFASILFVSCFVVSSAFGVNPSPALSKATTVTTTPNQLPSNALRKDSFNSALFRRDPTLVRGGAVPGWAAYNDALDKKPLLTKALTSLVGWALGDLLAQVRVCMSVVTVQSGVSRESLLVAVGLCARACVCERRFQQRLIIDTVISVCVYCRFSLVEDPST